MVATYANGHKETRSDKPLPGTTADAIDTERALVAVCMAAPERLLAVTPLLQLDDFYLDTHRWIYGALLAVIARREEPGVPMVAAELRASGRLAAIGGGDLQAGLAVLRKLHDGGWIKTAHAEEYARLVHRTGVARRLITAGGQIAGLGYDDDDLDTLISRSEQLLHGVEGVQAPRRETLRSAMSRVIDSLDSDAPAHGLTSGIETLDILNSGWHPGELVILAARPSNGKTSLATQFALAAAQNKAPVLFFSLEMSAEDLAQRALSGLARVDMQRLRTHTCSDAELARLLNCQGEAAAMAERITIDETEGRNIGAIRAAIRQNVYEQGTRLVILDHLQLSEGPRKSRNDSQHQEIAGITKALKLAATEFRVTIICLSQMSREVERRANHKPMLSDLRESGAIEADADLVMFIHRPELYEDNEEKRRSIAGRAQLIISKQRNGPLGDVQLRWLGQYTQFEEA